MSGRRLAPRRTRAPRRGGLDAVLLRRLPRESVVHRLWVGTKLIGLSALTVATGLDTSWWQLLGVVGVAALSVVAARVPWKARPRLPVWFWVILAAGLALAVIGGGGGRFVRLLSFSLAFAILSLVVAWTTDLADVGPALRTLAGPLRRLRLPVDEWALATVLAVRALPLLLDELRIVYAARRQRPVGRDPWEVLVAVVDLITAGMAAAVRRASDLGETMTLRGGAAVPRPAACRLFHARDALALSVVLAASVVPAVLS